MADKRKIKSNKTTANKRYTVKISCKKLDKKREDVLIEIQNLVRKSGFMIVTRVSKNRCQLRHKIDKALIYHSISPQSLLHELRNSRRPYEELKNNSKCKKCDSQNLVVSVEGNSRRLYCGECGAWQKWITKDDLEVARLNGIPIINNTVYNIIDTVTDRLKVAMLKNTE